MKALTKKQLREMIDKLVNEDFPYREVVTFTEMQETAEEIWSMLNQIGSNLEWLEEQEQEMQVLGNRAGALRGVLARRAGGLTSVRDAIEDARKGLYRWMQDIDEIAVAAAKDV